MTLVVVNDESGNFVGKVVVGDTKVEVLERLSHLGAGNLFDKNDVGLLKTDKVSAEGGPYVFKAASVQQQQQPLPKINVVESMEAFFNQKVLDLKLNEDLFIVVERMRWFVSEISEIYWRQCYSYILCTTIAFFQDAYDSYANAKVSEPRCKRAMALTGVQGTGKSVVGAVIALFMANAFGWRVHYAWGKQTHIFGNSQNKVIHIYNLSQKGTTAQIDFSATFILLVTSANELRWHDLAQQQSWNEMSGNYCFIDPATKEEVVAMGAARGRAAQAEAVYKVVGGVPRLCLEIDEAAATSVVKSAVETFSVDATVKKLSVLNDASFGFTPGTKLYPGLLGHIYPTNAFRNSFRIEVSSPYVARAIYEKKEAEADKDVQGLMNDLLEIPKARSFGGWLWEPLLTKKIAGDSSTITIVGSTLPIAEPPDTQVLLQMPVNRIAFFEFEDMSDFKTKAEEKLKNQGDICVFAKARSDTFAAIDAVIIIRNGDILTIAALQMTVAERYHPVQQATLLRFVTTCKAFQTGVVIQLWFLQPEKSLSYFGFVSVQALVFDEPQYPSSGNNAVQKSDCGGRPVRKRSRVERWGPLVNSEKTGQGRMQSNKASYWHESVKSVEQLVGIVHLEGNSAGAEKHNEFAASVREKMEIAKRANSARSQPVDPKLRSWESTRRILRELKGKVDTSLYKALQADIMCDEQAVADDGFDFAEVTDEG